MQTECGLSCALSQQQLVLGCAQANGAGPMEFIHRRAANVDEQIKGMLAEACHIELSDRRTMQRQACLDCRGVGGKFEPSPSRRSANEATGDDQDLI